MLKNRIVYLNFEGTKATKVHYAEEEYNLESIFFFSNIVLYNVSFFVERRLKFLFGSQYVFVRIGGMVFLYAIYIF